MNKQLGAALQSGDWDKLPHELKLCLEPDDLGKLLAASMLPADDCKHRKVWLFDTKAHDLAHAGLTLRLRKKKKGGDFTAKVRPVKPERIVGRWLTARTLEVEADVVGKKRVLSASVTRDLAPGKVVESADETLRDGLLTPLQRQMLADLSATELPLGSLRRTEPAEARVWHSGQLVIEFWELPNRGEALEISTCVTGHKLALTRAWLESMLEKAGVREAKEQATKSQRLLKTL